MRIVVLLGALALSAGAWAFSCVEDDRELAAATWLSTEGDAAPLDQVEHLQPSRAGLHLRVRLDDGTPALVLFRPEGA